VHVHFEELMHLSVNIGRAFSLHFATIRRKNRVLTPFKGNRKDETDPLLRLQKSSFGAHKFIGELSRRITRFHQNNDNVVQVRRRFVPKMGRVANGCWDHVTWSEALSSFLNNGSQRLSSFLNNSQIASK
jgi:hypothetical protein